MIVVNLHLSLMIQKPEKGGIFEYCPNIREPGNENFDEVKKVLERRSDQELDNLKLEPGDLANIQRKIHIYIE